MQTIAYTYDTPLYLKAKSFYDQELVCNDHIACNAGVEVMNAFFDWENARPVLILTGQVDELAGFSRMISLTSHLARNLFGRKFDFAGNCLMKIWLSFVRKDCFPVARMGCRALINSRPRSGCFL